MVTVGVLPPDEAPDHHGSHRDLLWSGDEVQPVPIDAIIVPTARPPAYLTAAADLASALDCRLVTLHSKQWTSADAAIQRLANPRELIAINVADPAQLRLPRWETSRRLADLRYPRLLPRTDLSAKRNLGLMLARMLGWSRIMFLDDDITELDPYDVGQASGLLSTYNAVGLHICGFHDHSVVCRAYREAGGDQVTFIGGGALVVDARRGTSFFPEIYNDDWFFLLDGKNGLQPAAVTGRVVQYPYDPFRPERARAEEFGDVLAEGVYWLLDQQLSIAEADEAHWATFLANRRHFIERVRAMVTSKAGLDAAEKTRRDAALRESLGRLALISPQLCVDYLRAWQSDQLAWRRHLDGLRTDLGLKEALAMLTADGAPPLTWRHRARAGGTAVSPGAQVRSHPAIECRETRPRKLAGAGAAMASVARHAAL
jgi:hypothetical protein